MAVWTAVAPEVFVWFQVMLEADYDYKFVATAMDYPFSWEPVKAKFVHCYSPAFAVDRVWNSLETLKRGTGTTALQKFNTKFLELASNPTAPAPIDLSVITSYTVAGTRRDRNVCTRCGGKGHWSASCRTKPEWKEGDPVSGYRGRGGTSRGTRSFGARRRGGTGALHLMREGVVDSGIAVDGADTADDGIAGSQEHPKN
ncbi:hypothetical protein B9Z19DRAFT_1137040 [Tuber borchii]|uniref:CCHC-type domain-containing protein n=1 Tax=Tuber borchii TaxID=42251 RepID=A0A2T6ZAZ0_TUBBO|nr:hypothetical protein B9Z19DRAFT_1137040 [Tuber borchii]